MKLLIFALFAALLAFPNRGQTALELNEVMSLVRTNLSDVSESELSRLAAIGLVKELGTKVQLVSPEATETKSGGPQVTRTDVFNQTQGYIRLRAIESEAAEAFQKAARELIASNKLSGLIIDLRYCGGQDYQGAAKIADVFIKGGEVLLKFGDTEVSSTDTGEAIQLPVAALVNEQTRGAAEAVAAILRETGAGLVIGKTTAGEARLFETFTLSTGQQLRIGKIPIQLGNGQAISSKGLVPDLAVEVSAADEQQFYEDPFKPLPRGFAASSGTNQPAAATNRTARRMNEAELVRRHREGIATDLDQLEGGAERPSKSVIMDPALARALDFLKGISVLRQNRPL